jgi:hypothetical protein
MIRIIFTESKLKIQAKLNSLEKFFLVSYFSSYWEGVNIHAIKHINSTISCLAKE